MRFSHKLSVGAAIVLIVSAAALSLAQTTPPPVKGGGENRLMRQSDRQCNRAVTIMQAALPIYHGHRVRAIEITKIAIDEINLGLHNDTKDTSASVQQRLGGLKNLNEPGGNYKKGQINNSNKRMVKAQGILTKAQANLTAAPKDYGGHRARALQLVNQALNEIQLALSGSN